MSKKNINKTYYAVYYAQNISGFSYKGEAEFDARNLKEAIKIVTQSEGDREMEIIALSIAEKENYKWYIDVIFRDI